MGRLAPLGLALLLAACGGKRSERSSSADPKPAAATPTDTVKAESAPTADDPTPRRAGGKWRDAGFYVDGQQLGVLWFGELPRKLEPVWVEEIDDLDFKPGDKGPRQRIIRQRRYRIADYLAAVGGDVDKVEMVHIQGGGGHIAVVPGPLFREWKDSLMFAFGAETSGKAIPVFPRGMPINTSFDRISAISIYVERTPPEVGEDFFPRLDGERVVGVPYFGTPLRGGVRVYKDDRLAGIIKRRKLSEVGVPLVEELDGHVSFELFKALAALDIDTSDVECGEIIYDERRTKVLPREKLAEASVKAISGRSGAVRFRDGTELQALALYTHEVEALPAVVD
jgi:hypothetical protein